MSGKQKGGDVRADLGLGEILKGLGGFIELLGELGEGKEIRRSGSLTGSGSELRGLYGLSIKSLGGVPVVEQFGNIHPTAEGPAVSDVREPLIDIFDEADHILVVAELPGVTNEEIALEVEGDILTLKATGRERRYAKELLLPALVDPASLHRTFQNAVLEIRLEKKK
jgi:HSP20 family protein